MKEGVLKLQGPSRQFAIGSQQWIGYILKHLRTLVT